MSPDVDAAGPWGVVVALSREERLLRGSGLRVARRGIGPERARGAAEDLVAAGCSALWSFGFAGGLDPRLRAGDLLLPTAVFDEDRRQWVVAAELRARVARQFPNAASGAMVSVRDVVTSSADKASLSARSRAIAVDMESAAIAAVAAAAGLPFAVLRAVSDPARIPIPATAIRAIGPTGSLRLAGLLGGLIRRPTDLIRLLRLAHGSAAGASTLRHAVQTLRR